MYILFVILILLAASLCWSSFTGLMYRRPLLQVVLGLLIIFFGMQVKHAAQNLGTLHILGLQEFMPRIVEFMDAAFIPVGSGLIISGLILRGQMLNSVECNKARKKLPRVISEYKDAVTRFESSSLKEDVSAENLGERWERFSLKEKRLQKDIKKLVKILEDNGDEPMEKNFEFYR